MTTVATGSGSPQLGISEEILETIGKLLEEAGIPEKKAQLVQTLKMSAYRGPWPPVDILTEYEKAFPGAGRDILELTKRQLEHRQSLETAQVSSAETRMDRGQWIALVIALSSIVAAFTAHIITGDWAFPALLAAVGVGGPTAGRLLIRAWPGAKSD